MKHDIIKTNTHLLIIDETEINPGNIVLLIDKLYIVLEVDTKYCTIKNLINNTKAGPLKSSCKKVIAHLPFDDSQIIPGLDLLPEIKFEEDDIEKLGLERAIEKRCYLNALQTHRIATEIISAVSYGYNTAREKYKHTRADLFKAIELARQKVAGVDKYSQEDILRQLYVADNPIGFIKDSEKNGVWMGKYIF